MQKQVITTKIFIPLLFIILALIFSVSTVSAAEVIYVNTTGNDSTGTGTVTNPYLTIQKGVDNVDPNGVIRIANGQYSGVNNTQITLNKNMTIIGQSNTNTIINGNSINWIFNIQTGVNVTLCNLKLTNGHTNISGGAIQNQGNLIITNCYITNNSANDGAGIANFNGNCTISNSYLINNTSSGNGGAILNYCVFNVKNSDQIIYILELNDCILTNNIAKGDGGAISNQCDITVLNSILGACRLDLKNCNFKGNSADGDGGAISNQCNVTVKNSIMGACVLNINDCILTNNITSGDGGAISNNGTLNIYDSSNGACVLNLNNGILSDNNARGDGGAISNQGTININGSGLGACVLNLNNNNLTSNMSSGNGGAVLNNCMVNNNGSGSTKTSLNVEECTFTNNNAFGDGGAIWNGCTANVNFNRFVNNTASIGNAVFADDTMDVTDNWWGSNYPEFKSLISTSNESNVIYSPWLYLTFKANPNTITVGSASILISSFNQHTDGTIITPINPVNGHIPDGTPVIFTTNLGNVGSNSIIKYTISGIAYAILRGDEGPGTAHVGLIADDQRLNTTVTITPSYATVKTIRMQETGIPLTGIVLAILIVIGGFLRAKKNL